MPDPKRALDIALAGVGLILGAPLLIAAAAAIKFDSPGPILFRQTRVGRNRQPFDVMKLRTMTVGGSGSQITQAHDRRVTRAGRWLRATKLDELPQLWNVLRGDMSVVGPRPEVPRFVADYRPEWDALFSVRPGMTDLASIAFRDEETALAGARDHERAYREVIMPMKLALALEGVRRGSLRHDFEVLVRTVRAVAFGPSAEHRALLAEARRRVAELDRLEARS